MYFTIVRVYTKFEDSGSNSTWKSLIDFYEDEKWTYKVNDKYEDAHLLLHNTSSHIQRLYQISKS